MKSRKRPFLSTSIALALASSAALTSIGCVDQEQSFYVKQFTNLDVDEMTGDSECTTDPIGLYSVSTTTLNGAGVLVGCVMFSTGLARPDEISSVQDDADPYAIILESAQIDVLRGGVAIESLDLTLSGRVGGADNEEIAHPIPLMSAATATSLAGSLQAGEATQLDIEIRAFGHTAGGLDLETAPFHVGVLFVNQ